MTENERRKFVLDAEFFVASHRPHKIFTVEDVINIAVGFAEKYITKKKDEQIEKMKCCANCLNFENEGDGYCKIPNFNCVNHSQWELLE